MHSSVIQAAGVVVLFWWVVTACYAIIQFPGEWLDRLGQSTALVPLVAAATVIGGAQAWLRIWSAKRRTIELLRPDTARGLTCGIGRLPLIARDHTSTAELPSFEHIPDVPADWYPKWMERYAQSHPAHVALARDLLRTFNACAWLPATHIEGHHGGRSLLEHSMLIGYMMHRLGESWSYKGLRDRSGKRIILKLRDPAYEFKGDDPMLMIIGLAHDIGKIEAYIYDPGNPKKVLGIHHEHDLTGGKMLGRMPLVWDLPDDDRRALVQAVSHYHHPMRLPLASDRRAKDDRVVALMELLIRADFFGSRLEHEGRIDVTVDPSAAASASPELSDDAVFSAFTAIVLESGRINSADARFNVGSLCDGHGFEKPMLLINETAIRGALMSRLQLPDAMLLGDGRSRISIALLQELDARSALYKSHEGRAYSAENSLWNVDFCSRPAEGAKPVKKSGWSATIILDPKVIPGLETIDPYWWYAIINRPTMGQGRAYKKVPPAHARKYEAVTDPEQFEAQLRQARAHMERLMPGDHEGEATSDDFEPAPEMDEADASVADDRTDAEQPSSDNQDDQDDQEGQEGQEEVFVEPEYAQTAPDPEAPTPIVPLDPPVAKEAPRGMIPTVSEKNVAPIDITAALDRAMAAAQAGTAKAVRRGDHLFFSNLLLAKHTPEIDWVATRYKIRSFCQAKKVVAEFVETSDGENYFLAIRIRDSDAVEDPCAAT
ncbi:hypothetical protein [Cupriavidus malaysiensis]|uniref:HD domain-containing protein n=1 Tax=Cupriavidus malaysiensis TaxID=367825 RepID=A0ABN4TZJ2_9BURK|nr:hypothetical protein [Cupriavidus malaysiensis]AOZ11175.1 hypothetical protein BKK80_35065 [Cupriavidus malaysiensis]